MFERMDIEEQVYKLVTHSKATTREDSNHSNLVSKHKGG